MKYAFIVLIAIYLITYGCSSDEPKEEIKNPKKVESITVDNAQPAAPATAVPQPAEVQQPAVQAEAEQPAAAQVQEQPAAQAEAENQPAAQPQGQPAPEQPMAEDTPQQAPPMLEEQADLFADPEDLVIMPCGRIVAREELNPGMPCMQPPQEEEPMAQEEPAMPQMMPPQAPPAGPDDLTAAVQKMAEATQEMVTVTKQMVVATEQLLKATKGAAGEIIDTGKKTPEAEKPEAVEPPAQPAEQPADPAGPPQAQVPAPAPSPREGMVESMKSVVAAAQEVVEVTRDALSRTADQPQQ